MGSALHCVHVNGLAASRPMGRARAFATAYAVAARPDAVVSVVRYATATASTFETVAVVARGTAAPVDAAPVDAAPVDAAPVDAYRAAWLAADTATADLVPFAAVADVVAGAVAETRAARRRVAETPTTRALAYETAARVRDAVSDRETERVRDAVADAASGYEPDAVAVVVADADAVAAFGMLQRSGIACIRPAGATDHVPAGAWFATCGARPALAFLNVADALAYATGHAAPSRRRRRVTLPGETTPPSAPSHGANAPRLPRF